MGLQFSQGRFFLVRVKREWENRYLAVGFFLAVGSNVLGVDFQVQKGDGYFEGSLRYVVSRYSVQTGRAVERKQVDVIVTENRLSVPSLDVADVFANNAPPGVSTALFRHDVDDFILYGDDIDAYRFRGYDKVLLGLAFRALALSGAPVDMKLPEKSGPYALRNFRANLSRYLGEAGIRYDMYLSKDYMVNWGSLADSWLFGSGGLKVPELDDRLRGGEVPVRVEVFRNASKVLSINLMAAEEYQVSRALVEVPPQKILHSSTGLLRQLATEAMGL